MENEKIKVAISLQNEIREELFQLYNGNNAKEIFDLLSSSESDLNDLKALIFILIWQLDYNNDDIEYLSELSCTMPVNLVIAAFEKMYDYKLSPNKEMLYIPVFPAFIATMHACINPEMNLKKMEEIVLKRQQ